MAAVFRFSASATIEAPTPAGSATRQTYVVPSDLYITADTNAIAQIDLLPDDYVVGSSTEPVVEMDLEYGSPYIEFTVTEGAARRRREWPAASLRALTASTPTSPKSVPSWCGCCR